MIFFRPKTKLLPDFNKPGFHCAFVLLKEEVLPIPYDLIQACDNFSDSSHAILVKEKDNDSEPFTADSNTSLALEITNFGNVFIGLMPAPIPNREAEDYFPFSVSSLKAGSSIDGHVAHLVVILMLEDRDMLAVDGLMAFTSLLAAIVKVTPSIGVYWGNAGATHTTDFFLSTAANINPESRLLLWSGIKRTAVGSRRMGFLSSGMNLLGLPNVYLECLQINARESMETLIDCLSYMMNQNMPIPEGKQIGSTIDQLARVRYAKSPAGDGEIVLRLDF